MTEPIRNLQMISSPGVGGRELAPPILARKLIAQGHPTWVMCRPGTLVEKMSRTWDVPVVATGMHGYFDPRDIWAAARFLKREKIQIIQSHWSRDLSNLIFAASLAGRIPIVLIKHVYSTEKKRDPWHAWVYRHTARVIAVSRLVEDNLLDTVPITRDKITTVYNGLELRNQWNPERVHRDNMRAALGVPPGKPMLGYVGRLNRGKGPHVIIEAFTRLSRDFPKWHLVLVGKAVGASEIAYSEKLQADVHAAGLADRVHWAGFRTDMPAVMHAFEALVCASAFESLGMVVAEAMAMERPVAGSDSGGIPEIIEDGKSGYLFQAGQPEDLERKLRLLLADPQRRRAMGKRGREIVQEKFNLDTVGETMARIYRETMAARRAGRR